MVGSTPGHSGWLAAAETARASRKACSLSMVGLSAQSRFRSMSCMAAGVGGTWACSALVRGPSAGGAERARLPLAWDKGATGANTDVPLGVGRSSWARGLGAPDPARERERSWRVVPFGAPLRTLVPLGAAVAMVTSKSAVRTTMGEADLLRLADGARDPGGVPNNGLSRSWRSETSESDASASSDCRRKVRCHGVGSAWRQRRPGAESRAAASSLEPARDAPPASA